MAEFPKDTRVKITRYGCGYGPDTAYDGREGVVIDYPSSRYITVKLDGAPAGSIEAAMPCMEQELEVLK
jgi:hypothetical protein